MKTLKLFLFGLLIFIVIIAVFIVVPGYLGWAILAPTIVEYIWSFQPNTWQVGVILAVVVAAFLSSTPGGVKIAKAAESGSFAILLLELCSSATILGVAIRMIYDLGRMFVYLLQQNG